MIKNQYDISILLKTPKKNLFIAPKFAHKLLKHDVCNLVGNYKNFYLKTMYKDYANSKHYKNLWSFSDSIVLVPPVAKRFVLPVRVIDGDGLEVFDIISNKILTIRLIGIDAFELAQPLGLPAKRRVQELLDENLKDYFLVYLFGLDKYKRRLGEVWIRPDLCLNTQLLKEGLAVDWNSHPISQQYYYYKKCQEFAKKQKINYWAIDNHLRPQDYKRDNKRSLVL